MLNIRGKFLGHSSRASYICQVRHVGICGVTMRHGVVIGAASITTPCVDSMADAMRQNQQHDAVGSTCSRTVDTNIGCLLGRLSMIGVDRVTGRFRISKNKSARNARNRTRTATLRRNDSDHAKCYSVCQETFVTRFCYSWLPHCAVHVVTML